MAIDVKTQPGTHYSVHDDLIYVVHEATKASDPDTYEDYRYVADVYAGSELVTRLKAYPHPDTKMGVFNISNILRNYITPVFNPTADTLICQTLNDGDFNVSGTVEFGEEYNFELFPSLVSSTGRKFFGHYNGRMLGSLTNLSAYTGKLCTTRPVRSSLYRSSSNNFMPFLRDGSGMSIEIKSYTSAGVLQGTSAGSESGTTDALYILNLSRTAINNYGTQIIDDNTAYFTVQINSGTLYRFDLVCEPKYTVHTLHFLNRFGGFESRDFTKLSRKAINIEKTEFGKLPYSVNASGEVSYHNANKVYNDTRSVFASQYKERMILNTDILSDNEYTWLSELILSPMVYIEMPGGYFVPVVIAGSDYEFRKSVNDKVSNLTINIEFGETFNAQYR